MSADDRLVVSRGALVRHLDALFMDIGVEPTHRPRVIDFVLAQIVVPAEASQ